MVSNAANAIVSSNATLTVIPFATSCVTAPTGLVSWWRAEDNALDALGTNNGTLAGNVTFGPGEVGHGICSDQPRGNMSCSPMPPSLQLQNLTIEAWIKRSNTNINGSILNYGPGGYAFWMDASGHLFFSKAFNVDLQSTGALITDTNFHHVAVTKSGSSVVFYVDGVGLIAAAP